MNISLRQHLKRLGIFIIDDLIKAKDLLPDKNFWDAKNKGRVTKASAYATFG